MSGGPSIVDKIVLDEFNRLKKLGLSPSSSKFAKLMNDQRFHFVLVEMQKNVMECQKRLKDLFIKSHGGYVGLVGNKEVKK